MNYLDLAIMSRNLPADEYFDPVIVATANRMFVRPDKTIGDEYLETLALNYGAGVYLADFGKDPEGMCQKINGWVEDQTYDRIKDLFPEGSIISDTAWVLVNAVYLKAPWAYPFEVSATEDMAFTRLDGSQVDVPTMHSTEVEGSYADAEGYKLADVPLRGGDLSVTFILPDQGNYEQIEDNLSVETVDAMLADVEQGDMEIYLPKFKVETGSLRMDDILKNLGMTTPFSTAADFSGFGPDEYPGISFVFHSVFVAADEVGVEAAAATGAGGNDSAPYPEILFDAHRPFIFLLRDRPTGLVLFAGRVVDPS
jgi:serpin B